MQKYREVSKRITGLLLAVCMFTTLFCDVPVRAAESGTGESISGAEITLYTDESMKKQVTSTSYTYDGNAKEPYVKVTYDGSVLTEGEDYTKSYSDNVNAGDNTATVTIKGTAEGSFDFDSTKSKTFTIQKMRFSSLAVTYTEENLYDGGAFPRPTVSSVIGISSTGQRTLTSGEYTLAYTDATVIGVDKGYFQVNLSSNYSCTTNPARYYSVYRDLSSESNISVIWQETCTFSGAEQKPAFSVYDNNTRGTVATTNYLVDWNNNINAGTATVTLTGDGDYRGEKTATFNIEPASIGSTTITFEPTNVFEYTGSTIDVKNSLVVMLGGYKVPATNYTVSYGPNYSGAKIGPTTAYVAGINNLKDEATALFNIRKTLATAVITSPTYTYTASPIVPTLTVTDTTNTLVSADNYSIKYFRTSEYTDGSDTPPTNVGTYYVQITGLAAQNHTGTLGDKDNPIGYRIVEKKISDTNIYLNDALYTDSSDPSLYYTGSAIKPVVKVREGATDLTVGVDYSVEYYTTSACTTVAENPTNVGTYYIKVTGLGAYANSEKVLHYNIAAQQISASDITVTADSMMYTGSPIIPTGITVSAHIGENDVEIASGGYTVACTNNTNIGTATLTVTLTGNYTGTASTTFQITPKSLNGCTKNYESNEAILNATYNGSSQKPFGNANGNTNITFRDGNYTLVEGTDYTINCYSSTGVSLPDGIENVGECNVIIEGIGNYADGTKLTLTFTVLPKSVTSSDITYTVNKPEYNATGTLSGVVTAFDNTRNRALVPATDYTIAYYKDAECTIPYGGYATAGVLYAQVRGTNNYTGTIVPEPCTIGTDINEAVRSVVVESDNLTYNGGSLAGEIDRNIVVIKNSDGSEMRRDTDYTVTYYTDSTYTTVASTDEGNTLFINAGTIYYTINGKGEYYGTYKANVQINKKSIASFDAVINGTYIYNGGTQVKPEIQGGVVTEGIVLTDWERGYVLTTDDYEVVANSYTNNTIVTDAATLTIRAKADSNYTGSRILTFRIVGMNLEDMLVAPYSLEASAAETVFNGMDQKPTVTVKYTSGSRTVNLRQDADFTIDFYSDSLCTVKMTDMKSAGTRYIKITGKGNYQGEVVSANTGCVFTINKRNINDVSCTLSDKTYYYSDITTLDKIPAFITKLVTSGNEYTLTTNDYTYEKTAIVDLIGPQSIILRAKDDGNFTGTKTIYFAYMGDLGKDIAVSGINESYEIDNYTSGIVEPTPTIKNKADGEVIPNSNFDIKYTNSNVVGEATITITPASGTQYWTGTYTYKYKIKGDIKNAEVIIPTQLYTGEPIENIAGMTVTCNGYPLVLGKDYAIRTYTNNTNAGLATSAAAPSVTIVGMGDYFDGHSESVKTQTFDIKYDIRKATIEATTENKKWTGSEVTLDDLSVTYDTAPLVNGVDYTVNYYNNINVSPANGKTGPYAEIVPTADGLLTGDPIIVCFSIGQVDISNGSIDGVADSYIYSNTTNKNPITPSTMKVKLADGTEVDSDNYKVEYKVVTADGTDPDVAAIETITVRGINNYTGTLVKEDIEILKRDLSDANQATVVFGKAENPTNPTYDGQAQEPAFTITFENYNEGEQPITLSTSDYTVESWNNNINAGVADGRKGPYVVITADSTNCKNSVAVPFTIEPKDVADLYYAPKEIPDQVYQAGVNSYTPTLTVKLTEGSKDILISNIEAAKDSTGATTADYTITYRNKTGVMAADPDNPAQGPNILIEARSSNKNFTGRYVIPFSITSRSLEIEDVDITLIDPNNDKFNTLEYNYPFDKDNKDTVYKPIPVVNDKNKDGELVKLIENRDYTFSYVNNDAVGTAQVVITGIGNYSGTRTIDFTIGTLLRDEVVGGIYPATIVIESDILDGNTVLTYDGKTHKLEDDLTIFECINGNKIGDNVLTQGEAGTDCDYSIKYYSNPECTIETDCIHAGTVYAKITGEAAGGYVGTLIKEYTIERKSIMSEDVVVDGDNLLADMYYNGSTVVPKPTIMDMGIMAPTGVKINNDCVLTYENNSGYGTGTLVITGGENGNYVGTRRVHFEILRQDIANATIDRIPNQIYTGSQITPSLVVTYNGNVLQAGRDYQLTYGNNTYAGIYDTLTYPSEAWIAIQGIGNYTGKVEKYFNIFADLKDATVQTITTQAYTGAAIRPAVSVKCGGNTLILNTDYTVEYTNNIAIGEATITIRPTASSCYTGTKVMKFYIGNSLATATVSNLPTAQTYTGRAIVPEPVVKIGSTTLVKGRDYSVQWKDNIKAGTASVVVTGVGTYAGTKTVNYQIIAKGITRCSVSSIADITYDGKSHSPRLVIRDGNKVLAQGTDYTLSNYRNNRLPGTGTFTLTGIGNYSGATTIKFDIIVAKMAGVKATPSSTSVKISWNSRSNVTGYQIYTSNCRTKLADVKTTSKTIKKLKTGKNYTYKVRTYLKIGKTYYYGAFTTLKCTTKPSTATLKSVVSSKTKQAVVKWSKVSNAAGYVVYRSTSKNGKYTKVATLTSKSKVSYTDKKLTKGKTYYYKVRTYRTINGTKVYGSYSNVKSVKVK